MEDAKLEGADMSDCNMSGANLDRADLRKTNLTNAILNGATLPAWDSRMLEGVRLTGATGWMPANKDLSNAKLQGADLSSCDLSGVNFSSADLRDAHLMNSRLEEALLPRMEIGRQSVVMLEGVRLTGATGWIPIDSVFVFRGTILKRADLSGCNLSGIDFFRADLSDADLMNTNLVSTNLTEAKMQGSRLTKWSSAWMEGVKLTRGKGWVPTDKDMRNAKLKGADLSRSDLSGVD
jgi:uncharacterized protein YjbI with pentapeptide repeats